MQIDYSLLATLHRMLRQQADLNDRLEAGPRQVRVATNNQAKFQTAVEQAKQQLLETKMAADEKQLHLGEREAKVEDLRKRLNVCDSNKEYQLLKDKIAADSTANGVLADEIFEMLERIDDHEAALKTAQESLTKAEGDTDAVKKRISEMTEKLQGQLSEIQSELAETEKRLKGDVGVEYRRLAKAKGEDALAKTQEGRTCGNCYHTFTAQTLNELTLQKAVFCKGCGCLMYTVSSVQSGHEA
jgi:predicted  nucleic acid-binding Zn-ribbon protein